MLGIEVTLQDDTKVPGCIFADQSCYLHEPICDMWASVKDMLQELDDRVQHYEVIGPVIALHHAKEQLEKEYGRQAFELGKTAKRLEQEYQASKDHLDRYVSFCSEGDIKLMKSLDAA